VSCVLGLDWTQDWKIYNIYYRQGKPLNSLAKQLISWWPRGWTGQWSLLACAHPPRAESARVWAPLMLLVTLCLLCTIWPQPCPFSGQIMERVGYGMQACVTVGQSPCYANAPVKPRMDGKQIAEGRRLARNSKHACRGCAAWAILIPRAVAQQLAHYPTMHLASTTYSPRVAELAL
jgi:hypothetical protein